MKVSPGSTPAKANSTNSQPRRHLVSKSTYRDGNQYSLACQVTSKVPSPDPKGVPFIHRGRERAGLNSAVLLADVPTWMMQFAAQPAVSRKPALQQARRDRGNRGRQITLEVQR